MKTYNQLRVDAFNVEVWESDVDSFVVFSEEQVIMAFRYAWIITGKIWGSKRPQITFESFCCLNCCCLFVQTVAICPKLGVEIFLSLSLLLYKQFALVPFCAALVSVLM